MPRLPKITIQSWTADGPSYTIHHVVTGWRNRRARRAGEGAEVVEQSADPLEEGVGAGYLVFAQGDTEVWAFRAGHVYRVEVLVDGNAVALLVDAREDDALQTYRDGIDMLEWSALEGDELEAALEAGGLPQPSNISDGAESQEPVVTLTGAQVEETSAPDEPSTGDADEPSTGDTDFDGTVPEFEEMAEAMTDDELRRFAEVDSRKGVREHAARQLEERALEAKRVADQDGDAED